MIRRFVVCTTVLLLVMVGVAFGQADRVLDSRSTEFDKNRIPIFSSRIVHVSPGQMSASMALLGKSDFVAINLDEARKLAADEKIDPQSMLNAQALAADAYAARREKEAENPFFSSSKGWMLQEARAHRSYAAYTRTISPSLHPFLIKAKAYYVDSGVFTATLEGDHLDVHNGSLGSSTPPLQTVPIIIFVERDIMSVSSSAEIAE